MTGATGNYYCGLHEFEDMSFLLHYLRPQDLFVDVGANVGSYTILASGHSGCHSISFEPVPNTFEHLMENIRFNSINDKVDAYNIAIGSEEGIINFTTGLDAGNHVVNDSNTDHTIEVKIQTLDKALSSQSPVFIKIDVEGYEYKVLEGAVKVLQNSSLQVLVIEQSTPDKTFGQNNLTIEQLLFENGFKLFTYHPWDRKLTPGQSALSNNSLFIKNDQQAAERVQQAAPFAALNLKI